MALPVGDVHQVKEGLVLGLGLELIWRTEGQHVHLYQAGERLASSLYSTHAMSLAASMTSMTNTTNMPRT